VLVTCEHGGHEVPRAYQGLFAGASRVLRSHRGWDPGALALARDLARRLQAPLRFATTTRLLVDLNRSAHNPRVFSERSRVLPRAERLDLLVAFHDPYRRGVDRDVADAATEGVVLHLSVHSFTPTLHGVPRKADIALLYDPRRPLERALTSEWIRALRGAAAGLRIRRNHPYLGRSDGLTTWLRGRHPPGRYLGIEIEVNQVLLNRRGRFPGGLAKLLVETLTRTDVVCRGEA